ncbi:serine/threonine-protein kinase Nek3 isoform X2 [Falco biarmicus]|uniref:serine/threonine-protein kinase Nek3 isoform X2 n=1 Tax=Falco peregrinus TaxID=8954 RepID=UPI000FFB98CE|nr:serine/threonine-protein kinase Nek3 isoform X2 [Falco peregrinus]XP_055558475.1 serine/threonine-protein kinase Nek3 isoform X2 [Falco cherrug]XP_056184793.1 serine/threonine-protein kinase Nek3 isoform X2 [Falco biarmicus]
MEEYKVLKILGEGSFGRALLVHHRISDQKYAMKEIRLPMSSSDVENSRKEAVLLAKMKHPNIVAYKESFEAGGHLYIVMEYCDDGDLMQKIKHQRGNLFPEEKILHWFVQMCLGVKHIHDKRVLHRDIKSKNIFLTQNGKVKLGDFGSARLLAHDIWSLGCILYELCTLRHPFQANSWKQLILKICKGSYNPLPSHYSYELHYLIKQMFKRNPQNRPSASTILARGSLTKLIKNCLPSEMANEFDQVLKETKKLEGNAARPKGNVMAAGSSNNKKENRRSKDESSKHSPLERKNITKDLSEGIKEQRKSNEKVETSDVLPGITDVSHPHRRQWEKKISNTVVDILENASLLSSSFTSEEAKSGCIINYSENKPRKQWNKETPQTLMDILSNADVSLAFKTYTIYKPASENILKGPLSDETEASDEVDGEHEAIVIDSERLEPRSDDDDTDFEEDDPDWVSELKMILKHSD